MILAFLLPLFRCTQKQTQAVNYPHHGKDGKKNGLPMDGLSHPDNDTG